MHALGGDIGRTDALGSRKDAVDQFEALAVLVEPDEVGRQGGAEGDPDRVVRHRREPLHGGTEQGNRLVMLATGVQRTRTEADHPRHGALVAKPLADLLRLFKERERQIGSRAIRCGLAGLLQAWPRGPRRCR